MNKLPWMKYDPDIISLDVDGMSLEEEGAYSRAVRHIWRTGPLSEARLIRLCGNGFAAIVLCMEEREGLWSFAWLEEARGAAKAWREQRSLAGKSSAEKRTTVQREGNDRSTVVLSPSLSPSISPSVSSTTSGKERAHEAELEPTFSQWFALYAKSRDKEACRTKWLTLGHDVHLQIMEHTRAYVIAQPDKVYRKDPIRYLQKQCWNDEVISATSNGPTKTMTDEQYRESVRQAAIHKFGNR